MFESENQFGKSIFLTLLYDFLHLLKMFDL